MSFNDTTSNVNSVIANFEQLADNLQRTMREEIKQVFTAFFEEFPQVKTIHWTQYTPYFNDGDECVFSLGEIWFTSSEYVQINEREHAWGDGDDGLINEYGAKIKDKKLSDAINTMERLLNSNAMEGVLKATYGDHVWVKVHKDGVEVDDYDHD